MPQLASHFAAPSRRGLLLTDLCGVCGTAYWRARSDIIIDRFFYMFSIKQHIWRQRDYFDIATCSEWTLMFQPGNYTYRYGLLHIWRHITMSWILIMRTEQNAEFSILHTHAHTNTHTHPGCYSCQVQWGRAAMMWVMRWKKTNLGSLQITTHSQTHTHTHTHTHT